MVQTHRHRRHACIGGERPQRPRKDCQVHPVAPAICVAQLLEAGFLSGVTHWTRFRRHCTTRDALLHIKGGTKQQKITEKGREGTKRVETGWRVLQPAAAAVEQQAFGHFGGVSSTQRCSQNQKRARAQAPVQVNTVANDTRRTKKREKRFVLHNTSI